MAVKEKKLEVIEQFRKDFIPSSTKFVELEEDQKLLVELNQLIDENDSLNHSKKIKKLDRSKKDRNDHLIGCKLSINALIHQQINR